MRALPTSWKTRPFNEGVPIPYRGAFDHEQFSGLKQGLVPQQMEDKWFIYYEEPYLFLHRSWTGQPVYRLTLRPSQGGAEVTEALWSKDPADASELDSEYQVKLIGFLLSNLVLGMDTPFPVPNDLNKTQRAVLQHHVSGTGFPTSGPEPKKQ